MEAIRNSSTYSLFALVSLVAAVLVYSHTPFGTAISMDSLSYINAARQMILHNGISLPEYEIGKGDVTALTLWPPAYPIVIAASLPDNQIFNVGIGHAITWLNVVSLAITLMVFLVIAQKISQKGLAITATILLALLPSIQIIFLYAWSETLFIPLILIALLLQINYLEKTSSSNKSWLFGSVAVLALAFQIRYAGLGLFGGLLASILVLAPSTLIGRIRIMAESIVLFVILVCPLMIRNYWLGNNMTGARDKYAAVLSHDLSSLITLLGQELLPFPALIALLILAGFAILGYVVIRRSQSSSAEHRLTVSIFTIGFLWSVSYLTFIVMSRQHYHTDLDTRMIGPAIPLLLISGMAVLMSFGNYVNPAISTGLLSLWLGSLALHGYEVHRGIIQAWRTTGTPGEIHGITYNSVSSSALAPFEYLRQSMSPSTETTIFTDLDRPQLLNYFYPYNKVKQIPTNPTAEQLTTLTQSLNTGGFVLISTEATASLLESIFGKTGSFFQIKAEDGTPYPYFVMTLTALQR